MAGADLCIGPAACLKPVRDGVGSAVSKRSTQAQQQSEADQRAMKNRGQADGTAGVEAGTAA